MKRQEIFKNPGYWTSKIQLELYDELLDYLEKNKLTRTQLAKKLGVSKGYISQILNGDFDHKISKLVELSLAIDKIPKIEFININEFISEDSEGIKTLTWKLKSNLSDIKCTKTDGTGTKEGISILLNNTAESLPTVINS